MPGYYSGLLEGMMAVRQMKAQEAMTAERRQTVALRAQEQAQQEQERQLMMQAFQGSEDIRSGLGEADALGAAADRMAKVGQRVMRIDPAKGLSMIREAGNLRQQKSLQEVRNIEVAQKKMETLGTVAMTVQDQTSLNDAMVELAKSGIGVPAQYRQWGPQAQQWWGSRAAIAKRNIEVMRADASALNAQTRVADEQRKERALVEKAEQFDRKHEIDRHGEYMKIHEALRKQYNIATHEGDAEKAKEVSRQMWTARREYEKKPTDWRKDPEVTAMLADVKSGTITREEFAVKMKELGYE